VALSIESLVDRGRIRPKQTIPDHMAYLADHTPVVHAQNATRPGEKGSMRLSWAEGDKSWSAGQLSRRLGDADWLNGAFTAGDQMMVSMLRRLKSCSMLDDYPNLSACVARAEARSAYKRAFDAQLAVKTGKQPTG
jgi:hypothetical protein